MAKNPADGETKERKAAGGGGAKKLAVPVVALLLGAFAGPKVLGSGSDGAAGAETTTTTLPGPVVTLDPVTLNLADGHLLKLGLALQISADWWAEHGAAAEAEAESDDPTKGYARALDAAITVFSKHTMDELMQSAVREAARTELTVNLEQAYEDRIEGIYLYEFVMQ